MGKGTVYPAFSLHIRMKDPDRGTNCILAWRDPDRGTNCILAWRDLVSVPDSLPTGSQGEGLVPRPGGARQRH